MAARIGARTDDPSDDNTEILERQLDEGGGILIGRI
jgi:predicted kinase